MTDAIWYYVDRQQQRHGPVSATAVAEAFDRGTVDDDSLVWREGLSEWTPLRASRDELGLAGRAATAPPLPTPRVQPMPPPAKSRSGCLIAVVVAACVGVPMAAILAAIALPAYNDYIVRAQMATALADARAVVGDAEAFRINSDRCPRDAEELGLAEPTPSPEGRRTELSLGEDAAGQCLIEARIVGGKPQVDGVVAIRLVREGDGQWTCTSDVTREIFLPASCRPR